MNVLNYVLWNGIKMNRDFQKTIRTKSKVVVYSMKLYWHWKYWLTAFLQQSVCVYLLFKPIESDMFSSLGMFHKSSVFSLCRVKANVVVFTKRRHGFRFWRTTDHLVFTRTGRKGHCSIFPTSGTPARKTSKETEIFVFEYKENFKGKMQTSRVSFFQFLWRGVSSKNNTTVK